MLARLAPTGRRVFALSRQACECGDGEVEWLQGNLFGDMPDLASAPIDTIVSVGPLDGLAQWLSTTQIPALRRIVALSSMSVVVKAASQDPDERAIAARLADAEAAVIAFCRSNDVACVLLRPTLIYGAGLDRSISALARFGQRWRVFPSIPAATGLRQPIHADDLAAACIASSSIDASPALVLAVGGGEQLSFAAMLSRTRASLSMRTIPIPVPLALARIALRALRLHPRWHHLHRGLIDRLCADQVVDNGPASQLLSWQPRGFTPKSATALSK